MYDFAIYDKTNNMSCYSSGNSFPQIQSPKDAVYMVEIPKSCDLYDCATLGRFGVTYFFDASLSSGAEIPGTANPLPIYMYTSRGWDLTDIMWNCNTTNVNTSAVSASTGSSFVEAWRSSLCASPPR